MGKLPFYQSCFPFRCDADVFQRHAKIVKYRVKISERVLTHANEGIRILVRLGKEMLGTEAFKSVYQLLNHKVLDTIGCTSSISSELDGSRFAQCLKYW